LVTGLWFFWGKEVAAAISCINRPEVTAAEEAGRTLACTNINLTAFVIIVLMLAGATAGRYSFKYVKSDDKEFRFIGHLTTFTLTFVIGILLVESAEIFGRSLGSHHWKIRGIFSMSYIAVVFYDLWDWLRAGGPTSGASGNASRGAGTGSGELAAANWQRRRQWQLQKRRRQRHWNCFRITNF